MSTVRESFSVVPRLMLRSASLLLPSVNATFGSRSGAPSFGTSVKPHSPRQRLSSPANARPRSFAWGLSRRLVPALREKDVVTRTVRPSRSALRTTTTLFIFDDGQLYCCAPPASRDRNS